MLDDRCSVGLPMQAEVGTAKAALARGTAKGVGGVHAQLLKLLIKSGLPVTCESGGRASIYNNCTNSRPAPLPAAFYKVAHGGVGRVSASGGAARAQADTVRRCRGSA